MKLKYRHQQDVGKIKIKVDEINEMLLKGASFDLNPAYVIYYDKDGNEIERKMTHLSLRLQNDKRKIQLSNNSRKT